MGGANVAVTISPTAAPTRPSQPTISVSRYLHSDDAALHSLPTSVISLIISYARTSLIALCGGTLHQTTADKHDAPPVFFAAITAAPTSIATTTATAATAARLPSWYAMAPRWTHKHMINTSIIMCTITGNDNDDIRELVVLAIDGDQLRDETKIWQSVMYHIPLTMALMEPWHIIPAIDDATQLLRESSSWQRYIAPTSLQVDRAASCYLVTHNRYLHSIGGRVTRQKAADIVPSNKDQMQSRMVTLITSLPSSHLIYDTITHLWYEGNDIPMVMAGNNNMMACSYTHDTSNGNHAMTTSIFICGGTSYDNNAALVVSSLSFARLDSITILDDSNASHRPTPHPHVWCGCKWRQLPSLPHDRQGGAMIIINNRIYIAGGIDEHYTRLQSIDCFDIATEQWLPHDASLWQLPLAMDNFRMVHLSHYESSNGDHNGGSIVLIGGSSTKHALQFTISPQCWMIHVDELDDNRWQPLLSLPVGVAHMAATLFNHI